MCQEPPGPVHAGAVFARLTIPHCPGSQLRAYFPSDESPISVYRAPNSTAAPVYELLGQPVRSEIYIRFKDEITLARMMVGMPAPADPAKVLGETYFANSTDVLPSVVYAHTETSCVYIVFSEAHNALRIHVERRTGKGFPIWRASPRRSRGASSTRPRDRGTAWMWRRSASPPPKATSRSGRDTPLAGALLVDSERRSSGT